MSLLKVFLDTQSFPVSGAYPLVFGFMHKDEKVIIRTLYSLSEKNFDYFSEQAVISAETSLCAEKVLEINRYLRHEANELESIICIFENDKNNYKVADLVDYYYHHSTCNGEFDDYVFKLLRQYKKRGGKINLYLNLLKQISAYNKKKHPLRCSEIDNAWIEGFFNYLSFLNISQSAIESYERAFKRICQSASNDGLLQNYGRQRKSKKTVKNRILDSDIVNKKAVAGLDNDSSLSHACRL